MLNKKRFFHFCCLKNFFSGCNTKAQFSHSKKNQRTQKNCSTLFLYSLEIKTGSGLGWHTERRLRAPCLM